MPRFNVRLRAGVALAAMALAVSPVLGAGAGASGPGADTMVAVAQGINLASIPGAAVFGTTPANTPEQVSFILNIRNQDQLAWNVQQGLSSFLSVGQFAQYYGQTPTNIASLQTYLSKFGIATQVYPDNLDVTATGTAGQFDQALAVQQDEYHVPGFHGAGGRQNVAAQTVHGAVTAPELPYRLSQFVLAILGLTNYAPFASQAVHMTTKGVTPQKGSSSACLALVGLPNACNTPADFASNYNLSPLYHQTNGSGQTIGIVTLAALDPGAAQYFWSNVLGLANTGRSVTVENVDGGPGAPSYASGSSETDLDVEQSGGVAPGANITVYQAPNTDFGYADAFFQAASENVASSVSASWGESETLIQASVASGVETPAYQAAFDEAFLEMAAQGQSGFTSAGDAGAYDASADLGTTNLAVDAPADSPYITAAGGTTLPFNVTFSGPGGSAPVQVKHERAWGWDYLWGPVATVSPAPIDAVAESLVVGGGGGSSVLEPMPSYQQGVSGTHTFNGVGWLTPTAVQNVSGINEPTAWTFNSTPSILHGQSAGRAVPDLSADADPESGYLEYSPSFADVGGSLLQGGWGGTSFVAPQLNAAAAIIDAYLGHRVGLWNPSIYAFATSDNSPFNPLQQVGASNDNIFFTGTPGALYNEAVGLGVPNLARLARDFAH